MFREHRILSTFVALLVLFALSTLAAPPLAAQTDSPVAVVDAFIAAENARNVDRALALFADDAVISESPDAPPVLVHTGKEAIRAYLQRLVDGYVAVEVINPPTLVGEYVEWTERIGESALVQTRQMQAKVLDGKIESLQVTDIMLASGRTVPWTGGAGWTDAAILALVLGLMLLIGGGVVWRRSVMR